MSDPDPHLDLGSVFLGAKGENAEVFERLLLEAFRDHVFWRRNFHPEDGFLVLETEKHTAAYQRSISVLSQELMGLLAELKGGVPFFSPRYKGHMCADLTMAGMVGYFAAMLYNPNNVSAEASPVTSRMELQVAAQLASMVGYDAGQQWGHLTSGGTVANIEALWVARNIKYLPVAVHWAAVEMGEAIRVRLPGGDEADVRDLDLWRLLNLDSRAALDAASDFRALHGDPYHALEVLSHHSLSGLGYQEFGRRLASEFGDALPPAVVLVPSTAHYSWDKICRSLGIGGAQLVHVPVDERFRMSSAALEETLRALASRRQSVIACVAVIGTTEESAVDRLDEVLAIRDRAASELGLAFHVHADAAWGGYAASVLWRQDGSPRTYADVVRGSAGEPWPQEDVFRALAALAATDSVTIDPHKLGYVPYPAGAISFRDGRVRELVAVEAPYIFHGDAPDSANIGRFILEGSKPGAAAASVWMSHKVLPLDVTGYGRLIGEAARGALALHRRIAEGDWSPFAVAPLPRPDLNIVCFGIRHPSHGTLHDANSFVGRVYRAMSAGADRPARQVDYFVTMTTLRTHEYGSAALPLVTRLGFSEDDYRRAGGIAVIRCTVMDAFLASARGRVDHVEGFAAALLRTLHEVL
jgi:glutamate/tyrosine decarboxylase-like PLP-dependent enzyme